MQEILCLRCIEYLADSDSENVDHHMQVIFIATENNMILILFFFAVQKCCISFLGQFRNPV